MERLGDDELALVLRSLDHRRDRESCARVCQQWRRIEALSRTSLRVIDPFSLPQFLPRFPNLTALRTDTPISDAHLHLIARSCPDLRSLILNARRSLTDLPEKPQSDDLTDAGLGALALGCQKLQHIALRNRRGLGDSGVVELVKHASDLSYIDLTGCSKVSDRAVAEIGNLTSLSVLCLRSCFLVTDIGLTHLANRPSSRILTVLDLSECDQITDAGVCELKMLPCLEKLSLADCGPKVTDVGVSAIASIDSLRSLDLSWLINLSDATLFELSRKCKKLEEINVTGCELITGAGVLAFSNHASMKNLVLASCHGVSMEDVVQTARANPSLRYIGLDKSLRGWMSSSVQENIGPSCEIYWL